MVSPFQPDAFCQSAPLQAPRGPVLPTLPATAEAPSSEPATTGWKRAVLGSFAAFAAVGALMGTPTSAPLAAETARQAVVPVSVSPAMVGQVGTALEAPSRDAAIDGMLDRGRPGVSESVRAQARAQLRGVPLNVLNVLEKSDVRVVVLHEGESLADVGAVRTLDLDREYGDGSALRTTVEHTRDRVDATWVPKIKTLQQALMTASPADVAARDEIVSDLEIARSDRNESLYKAVYDASGGRLDQQDGMAATAEALGLDAAGPLSLLDVARIHGARTPQEVDRFVRLLRAVNGDARLEMAQRKYAAESETPVHPAGDIATRPMRLWREGIVVPSYEHVRGPQGRSAVVSGTDAISLRQWNAGDIEGQYFYEGKINTLVVHERNMSAKGERNHVLLHELGHAYEDAISEQAPVHFGEWRARRDADFDRLQRTEGRFPSEYASRSASELSAETFVKRFDDPHRSRTADGRWEKTYDELLNAGKRLDRSPPR